jgi:hypothetical protein
MDRVRMEMFVSQQAINNHSCCYLGESCLIKPTTITLLCVASLLRSKTKTSTGWLRIKMMCLSGATRLLLFQWANTIKIQLSAHLHPFIEWNLFLSWCSWKIAQMALSNNNSPTNSLLNSNRSGCLWPVERQTFQFWPYPYLLINLWQCIGQFHCHI